MIDIVFAAVLASSNQAAVDPCALATATEIEELLGGGPVPMSPDEIGEETAPSCIWATGERDVAVKVAVWSAEELPVLGMANADAYYRKLEAEASGQGRIAAFDALGERAFETSGVPETALPRDGTIVVLKKERVIVMDFTHVAPEEARAFAKKVAGRL
jgi:hypothetical protein